MGGENSTTTTGDYWKTTDRLTGEVVRILNEAAELAIRDGTERVTLEHLEYVAKAPA